MVGSHGEKEQSGGDRSCLEECRTSLYTWWTIEQPSKIVVDINYFREFIL